MAPALVLLMMTGLRKMPKPTAVQSEVVGHEMPLSPLTSGGMASRVHAYPALNEAKMVLTPAARHSALLGHEVELS